MSKLAVIKVCDGKPEQFFISRERNDKSGNEMRLKLKAMTVYIHRKEQWVISKVAEVKKWSIEIEE